MEKLVYNHEIKMIVTDLDGTLLYNESQLTERTRKILELADVMGVLVVVATGRSVCQLPEAVLDTKGIRFIITSNGAVAIDLRENRKIMRMMISHENALRTLDIINGIELPHRFEINLDDHIFSEKYYLEHIDEMEPELARKGWYDPHLVPIDDAREFLEDGRKEVEKFNIFFRTVEERNQGIEMLKQYPFLAISYSLEKNIEVNDCRADKGSAIELLAKSLNIRKENIIGFGDGTNDISLLSAAGLAVATDNAAKEVKEIADYVTLSNRQDGVAEVLERLITTD
ncbi:MAG: Cof-type HAD-IIB family hydrolase [bacterium]|nr:Cof-type HAD-IIB family hydrolase [bacterium]